MILLTLITFPFIPVSFAPSLACLWVEGRSQNQAESLGTTPTRFAMVEKCLITSNIRRRTLNNVEKTLMFWVAVFVVGGSKSGWSLFKPRPFFQWGVVSDEIRSFTRQTLILTMAASLSALIVSKTYQFSGLSFYHNSYRTEFCRNSEF